METIVTIAIPDFSGAAARAQTLDALARHTRLAHEIVLFVKEGLEQHATGGIRLLPVPSPFSAPAALNRLLGACHTPYILFLEAGAIGTPGWLARLLEPFQDADVALSGPSTNLSWNEQQVLPRYAAARSTGEQIDAYAASVATRYAGQRRSLNTLHSLADFCYLFKRLVAEELGGFDEAYGSGPCWEIDFTTRAARAGFRAVWVMDAYVHRSTVVSRPLDAPLFTRNKQLYQDRFCGLRLSGKKTDYQSHCRGEACEHFAPIGLIKIRSGAEKRQAENDESSRTIGLPLVSCIMPTRNRRPFVQQALRYFERQDYPNKELVIVDDGDDRVADLVASYPNVRYEARSQHMSIGAKRNLACELARGSIIAHWDDDDWYAPHRLSYQVAPLIAGDADIVGLETSCFFDLPHWQAWACSPALHRRLFTGDLHGGTLVYRRHVWEHLSRYPNLSVAEDAHFLLAACRRQARLQKLPHAQSFVYLRHEHNAWRFPLGTYLDPAGWQKVNINEYIPAEELAFYHDLSSQTVTGPAAAQYSAPARGRAISQGGVPAGNRDEERPRALVQTNSTRDVSPSEHNGMPLVSCIMPTFNRPRYMQQSIKYFLRQDYPNRELIILDDSPQRADDLIPVDPRIRYIHLDARMILGAKRNLACRLAHGSIIAHWDDDDWIAPQRLRIQVELMERQRADVCGTYRQLYYDSANNRAWLYEYPRSARRLPLGNTLCYRKSLWERNPFPEIAVGEDTRFVWSRQVRNIAFQDDHSFYIGLIHSGNTSRKILIGACWHALPVEEVHKLLDSDLDFYCHSDP